MKADLKINFVDFWSGFNKTDNYFNNLLSKHYNLIFDDEPDILFYSCYGREYLRYKCIRIFFASENIRPDFSGCDYALSFDYINKQNHFRFPLYALYIDHLYPEGSHSRPLEELTAIRSKVEMENVWRKKTKFCCMVVSNPNSKKRLNFFNQLSMVKKVDSGGRTMNNIGGPVHDKLEFIKDYKFVIAFENQSYPGYTTEKIIEPFFTDSIPIYWGNPEIGKDFNDKRFIDYNNFKTEEEVIEYIIEIEKNSSLAVEMLLEPIFPGNKIPEYINAENVLRFLQNIISKKDTFIPVAQTFKRSLHFINRKKNTATNLLKAHLGMNKK